LCSFDLGRRKQIEQARAQGTGMSMLQRTAIALVMLSAWGTLTSCTSESSPDTFLQQEVDHLQKRTMPPDSRLVDQHLTAIHGWGARADWEFQTYYGGDTYLEWLAHELRPDFENKVGTSSPIQFSKDDQGDVETLSVTTTRSAGLVLVTVRLEIYPD